MSKSDKKPSARKERRLGKKVSVEGEKIKHGKKRGGSRKCSGWILTLPDGSLGRYSGGCSKKAGDIGCRTCKRKFCSDACHDSHEELCRAKDKKDIKALLKFAHRVYDEHVDKDGHWGKEELDGSRFAFSIYCYGHRDLTEARAILKQYDPEYFRGSAKPYGFFS